MNHKFHILLVPHQCVFVGDIWKSCLRKRWMTHFTWIWFLTNKYQQMIFKSELAVKAELQFSHWLWFLTSVSICVLLNLISLKKLSHTFHIYDVSLQCVRIWTFQLYLWKYWSTHFTCFLTCVFACVFLNEHSLKTLNYRFNMYMVSLQCVCMWTFKFDMNENVEPQILHEYSFSPVCLHVII